MSAILNECAVREVGVEVMDETDVELIEVGAVSETKGGVLGVSMDNGAGYMKF